MINSTLRSTDNSLYTGWESYADTQYTEAFPLSIIANTQTVIPNNFAFARINQSPIDVDLINTTNSNINGREGDGISIDIFVTVKPLTNNATVELAIDIGGTIGKIYKQSHTLSQGANVAHPISLHAASAYTLDTWEANGGTPIIICDENIEVYDIIWTVSRTHKSRT